MSGFSRRYGFFPGSEVITQIEGVIIVDAPPPGAVNGISTGCVGCVGEFADMQGAVAADASGNITTSIKPQRIFSGKDLTDKVGGFDETLGEFGVSCGNGYAHLRNKQFTSLIVVPVNLCSARGVRVWRQLPVCKSTTDTNPVTPVLAASVSAGREFRLGSGRLRLGTRVNFTALDTIVSGTGGSLASSASAVTQLFTTTEDMSLITRPDGTFGARKGDILVIGSNSGGSFVPTAEAGTYRVAVDATTTSVTIERLDGASFAITTQSNIPWRLHVSSDADSAPVRVPGSVSPGGYGASDGGGYSIPARPLTTSAGATTDGSWPSGTLLSPAVAPQAATGSSWDALSGLGARTYLGAVLTFTAAIQGVNAVASASIDALYTTAIDALLADKDPQRDINIVIAARKSTTIASKLKSHALESSSRGLGRIAIISPALSLVTLAAAGADTAPGVGGTRDEGVFYSWPGCQHSVPEAVNFRLKTADGLTTVDGILDDPFDGWLAALLSNLAPERNPGQAAAPVPQIFAPILNYQRACPDLSMPEYIFLRSKGIAALRLDKTSGPIIQSGVTTSLISGQKDINRRRFSYFIQDSCAARLMQYGKLPISNQLKDGSVGELNAFGSELLSENNPSAQRIDGYLVDDKSGNTPDLLAKGIFVVIFKVKMTPISDFIVFQAEVGNGVNVTQVG